MEHLTLRIRVRPRPHRSNSLFTKFEWSREPTVVTVAKRGALYAPRGASSKETMGDDETTLELRSTSILSKATRAEFDRRKKPISRGRRRLFSRQREQRRPETHRGKYCGQADSSTRMLRLLEGGLKKPTVRGWLGEKFINLFLERLVARTESQ